ncbi:glycine zipper 2TM domain-containing protein [bacterium]|nr:glycine zipper 2TM domain-containing protein [bacterium]
MPFEKRSLSPQALRILTGTAAGTVAGAAGGRYLTDADDENRTRNTVLGGLAGGVLGGLGGHAYHAHRTRTVPVPFATRFGAGTPDPVRPAYTSSGVPIYAPQKSRGSEPHRPTDIPLPAKQPTPEAPLPKQRTGPLSPDAAQMRADLGMDVTASLRVKRAAAQARFAVLSHFGLSDMVFF